MAPLHVIALISGGKDSFLSIYHCLAQGHRVVAVANLYPPPPPSPSSSSSPPAPGTSASDVRPDVAADDAAASSPATDPAPLPATDLNSYMFQTAGHALVASYAAALTVPVYRAPVRGRARDQGKEYGPPPPVNATAATTAAATAPSDSDSTHADGDAVESEPADETESLLPLLRRAMRAHPDATALCAGAVLSTYQRTRVESVAARLGLTPLAPLWQYPSLPFPASPSLPPLGSGGGGDGAARLLGDVAALGLDARVVKVASGGLEEGLLWASLREAGTRRRVEGAVGRFGGSVLGEGGEYETLVLEGPGALWRGRVVVGEEERVVRRGEGGECWLEFRGARVEERRDADESWREKLSRPALWNDWIDRFDREMQQNDEKDQDIGETNVQPSLSVDTGRHPHATWTAQTSVSALSATLEIANLTARQLVTDVEPQPNDACPRQAVADIESQARDVCAQLQAVLHAHGRAPRDLLSTTLLLRSMADFGAVNAIYGRLFSQPLPPARVTVAAGNRLPRSCRLLLHATASRLAPARRHGLHVQSRSYWAPANIGPYAQAIGLRAAHDDDDDAAAALVFVAGQIPLVPATMELVAAAAPGSAAFRAQAQLALQHLWAVGVATGVTWWTHGVAYLAADRGAPDGRAADVRTAWRLWKHVHRSALGAVAGDVRDAGGPQEAADEADGVDLWELRHGRSRHGMSSAPAERPHRLPDFACVEGTPAVPAFFAVEVAELPRGGAVEWHSLGTAARGAIESHLLWTEGTLQHSFTTGAGVGRNIVCVGVLLKEGWEDLFQGYLKVVGLGSDETARAQQALSSTTVYTPFPAVAARCRIAVVPCQRVWAGDAEELAAAIITRTED